ncbi:MAG: DUF5682 family protein [Candidatus Hermodarchaeota archaeon]
MSESLIKLQKFLDWDENRVFYFPVRHHSPICAYHLSRLIEDYRPEAVLIEGPVEANHLIPAIADSRTIPPVAIYCYYVDQNNKFGLNGLLTPNEEIPMRFHSWYPFASFSPEYEALKAAVAGGAEVRFIDLPLEDRLKHQKKIVGEKLLTRDILENSQPWAEFFLEHNKYVSLLIEKTFCRDFNEWWEQFFEIEGYKKSWSDFVWSLYNLAYISRTMHPKEYLQVHAILEREKFMLQQIKLAEELFTGKILVVTGALHSVALPFLQGKKKVYKQPNVYNAVLTPYSYLRLSEKTGYAAGVPSPFFYQCIWQRMKEPTINDPFDATGLFALLQLSRNLQETSSAVSTADSINAYTLAKNLAAFRGRSQIAREDILDAITTCYVKGEQDVIGIEILRQAEKFLIGEEIGTISADVSDIPIIEDFNIQAKKNRIKLLEDPKSLRVEIYKRLSHREKSRFLHQTVYLELGFAELEKGPNLLFGTDLHLLTEQWIVVWDPHVHAKLIENAAYGSTVAEASTNRLKEAAAATSNPVTLTYFLLRSAQMGLFSLFDELIEVVGVHISINQDFIATVDCLKIFVLLASYREVFVPKNYQPVLQLVDKAFTNSIAKIPDLVNAPEEQITNITDRFNTLSQLVLTSNLTGLDESLLLDVVKRSLTKHCHPKIQGIFMGLLYTFNQISEADIINTFEGFVYGNRNIIKAGSDFLEGLFLLNKSILMTSSELRSVINKAINHLPNELFIQLLPGLRKAFNRFTPREKNYIAEKLAELLSMKPSLKLNGIIPSSELLLGLSELDEAIMERIKKWRL